MKISVIMPSYLGEYEGAAKDRPEKFKRAVKSFIENGQQNTELIIVSDGCLLTKQIFDESLLPSLRQELEERGISIRLIEIDKQPAFSGAVRNAGLEAATGEVICYLDTDDVLLYGHLAAIRDAFSPAPGNEWQYRRWVYFNDFLSGPEGCIQRERTTTLCYGGIGTGGFAHERSLNVSWPDGYGHDWGVVHQLLQTCPHTRKVFGPRYLVCHLPPHIDF